MTLVNRDPFARIELHRERVYLGASLRGYVAGKFECAWCGRTQCTPRSKKPYLFCYRTESDGGRVQPDYRLFCSIECRRAFNS